MLLLLKCFVSQLLLPLMLSTKFISFHNTVISMTVVLPFQEHFMYNLLKGKFFTDTFFEVGHEYENGYHGLNIPHYQLSA